jgi:choline dehydrogenase-like flavoprotein
MIVDLDKSKDNLEISADLCVIGSGAAGLAIASDLIPCGINMVLVESGGYEFEPATQALYDVEVSGLPHPGSTQGRFRVLGGSTTKWGGQALPLMRSDFERRDWVANSGWPLSFDELASYYERASRFLMIDNLNFDTDLLSHLKTQTPPFDPGQLWYHFSKWSPKPNIREQYLPRLRAARNCTLLLHANATEIHLDNVLRNVVSVQLNSLEGGRARVRARAYVLCAGGIETARLLLANNKQVVQGIGNANDLVGRFFQDHPSAFIGRLKPTNPARVQNLFNVFHKNGLKYSVRCTATSAWQRRHQALNISMGISFTTEESSFQDVKDVYVDLRRRNLSWQTLSKILRTIRNPTSVILPAYYFACRGRTFAPRAQMRIAVTAEQAPGFDSRISLSRELDALGVPRAQVRWHVSDQTLHTIQRFAMTVRDEFLRIGLGEIAVDSWLSDNSSEWTKHITDQNHHMGTTRMSDSPKTGVVDRDCRVHGLSNLFIGSSSVFPSGGHSNPTLTIIALSLRLADRLKQELQSNSFPVAG